MPKLASTPLELHLLEWQHCMKCSLSTGRRKVCLFRNDPEVPCDVLFVGEAPGESEDISGEVFDGPAGMKLDMVFERAKALYGVRVNPLFVNLVGCYPREAKKTKDHRPPADAIIKCAPRLVEVIHMVQPALIVCVGSLPRDWLMGGTAQIQLGINIPKIHIKHPSAVLKGPEWERQQEWSRMVDVLHRAFDNYLLPF